MLRRDDETEMVPMLGPVPGPLRPIHSVVAAVEEDPGLPLLPGAVSTEITDMGR
ncbi:hypothetical protein D3C86_2125400 [compost metagenome]